MVFKLTQSSPRIRNRLVRELIGEAVATFTFVFGGLACNAQFVLSRGEASNTADLNIGWGLAVMLGGYCARGISGAITNPSITAGLTSLGQIRLYKAPLYMLSQTFGAFIAAALVYALYNEALDEFDGGTRSVTGANATAGIFSTYPKQWLSTQGGLLDQIIGTAYLQLGGLAINDEHNGCCPNGIQPLLVGLLVTLINMSMIFNCGAAINPGRDLGPRIFTAIAGWGKEVFSFRDYNWFWVPIVGPFTGAVLGAQIYYWLIGRHHPALYKREPCEGAVEAGKSTDTMDSYLTSVEDIRACSNDIKYVSKNSKHSLNTRF